MARQLRINCPGAFYHVTSRGNEQAGFGVTSCIEAGFGVTGFWCHILHSE